MISKLDLEDLLKEFRPGCAMSWVSDKHLSVKGFAELDMQYRLGFSLGLYKFEGTAYDYDSLSFTSRFSSLEEIPLQFVDELNKTIRFVRHSTVDVNDLVITLDIVGNSFELTKGVFEKNYTFFTMALDRIKMAFPKD